VTDTGKVGGTLLGIATSRDCDLISNKSVTVSEIMTPLSDLVTGPQDLELSEAYKIMRENKKSKLPIIN